MEPPRRNLPKGGRHYIYHLIFFYVFGILPISCTISRDKTELLSKEKGAGSSPSAIAASEAGTRRLDLGINRMIVASAWPAGNAALCLAGRIMHSRPM
jgi:amino acid transporter